MASPEASSSRAVVQASRYDDAAATLGASPDEMAALGELLSRKLASSSATDLADLGSKSSIAHAKRQRDLETRMLEQAPSYLKLHDDLQASQTMLGELSSFLDVFHTDLSALSTQMDALQTKSVRLRQRLQNRRALEGRLRDIVDNIVLSPQDIDLIFADETTAKGAGLDAWRGCAERLSACLFACQELEGVFRKQPESGKNATSSQIVDFKALKEAREVAEACRTMAAAKLRPLLMLTFAPLRTSLSTNLPIWQSILLRQYRPLYRFLSQHVPRVAIDVQRAYISAARLYFETGFRRYERTLAKLRDKEKARGIERVSFADAPTKSGLGPMFISTVSGSSKTIQSDVWMPDASQLDLGKMADGPAVILAYLADEPNFRTSLESLYRSLSLTFLDNASSEFCFLARFFEGIDLDTTLLNGSVLTGTDQSSGVKVRRADARSSLDEDGEPLPEDSASARGDTTADGVDEVDQGTVVRLSEIEQRRLQSRGAIGELWKQVMEPSLNTYTAFVKSIVELQPQLVPLYIMLRLNERMLDEIQVRGTASILQGPFMAFKLQAWPMLQKQFDEAIESVKGLHGADGGKSASGAAKAGPSGFLGGFSSYLGGGGASTATAAGATTDDVLRLVCTRYAYLFSSVVQLNSSTSGGSFDDTSNADTSASNVFASLTRLRTEIETLIRTSAARTPSSAQICYSALRNTLETGPASLTSPAIQKELSHWTEAERASRR